MKGRKVTVLIVPDFEGTPHTFKLSLLTVRTGIVLAVIGVVIFAIMVLTWRGMLHKANQADHLAIENEQYRLEQQRVLELEARVQNLQNFENQIRRALGSDFAITSARVPPPMRSEANGDEVVLPEITSLSTEIHPVLVRSTFQSEGGALVHQGAEIPSLWPVEGFISRGFEWNDVVSSRSHTGVDIAGKEGTVVRATAGGVVVWCGWSARFGNLVVLAHRSGYFSVYGHNQVVLVEPRQHVERGSPIALLGNTGQSSAPHLHFEIWLYDQPLDPLDLLIAS